MRRVIGFATATALWFVVYLLASIRSATFGTFGALAWGVACLVAGLLLVSRVASRFGLTPPATLALACYLGGVAQRALLLLDGEIAARLASPAAWVAVGWTGSAGAVVESLLAVGLPVALVAVMAIADGRKSVGAGVAR